MKKKFVYTLTLLSLLFASQAYGLEWLEKLESKFIGSKTKTPKKTKEIKPYMKMKVSDSSKKAALNGIPKNFKKPIASKDFGWIRDFTVEGLNKKELQEFRNAYVDFLKAVDKKLELEKFDPSKVKSSSINFELLQNFLLSSAHAQVFTRAGQTCYFSGFPSEVQAVERTTGSGASAQTNTAYLCRHPSNLASGNANRTTYETAISADGNNCGNNRQLCNPRLFGNGVCADVSDSAGGFAGLTTRCEERSREEGKWTDVGDTSDPARVEEWNRYVTNIKGMCPENAEDRNRYDACKALDRRTANLRIHSIDRQAGEQLERTTQAKTDLQTQYDAMDDEDPNKAKVKAQIDQLTANEERLRSYRVSARGQELTADQAAEIDRALESDEYTSDIDAAIAYSETLNTDIDEAAAEADDRGIIDGAAGSELFEDGDLHSNGDGNKAIETPDAEWSLAENTCGTRDDQPVCNCVGPTYVPNEDKTQCITQDEANGGGPQNLAINTCNDTGCNCDPETHEEKLVDGTRSCQPKQQVVSGENVPCKSGPGEPEDPPGCQIASPEDSGAKPSTTDDVFACQGSTPIELPKIANLPPNWNPTFLKPFEGQLPDERNDSDVTYGGTQPFLDCQIYSHYDWKEVVRGGKFDDGGVFAQAWATLYKELMTGNPLDQYKEAWGSYHAAVATAIQKGDQISPTERDNITKYKTQLTRSLGQLNARFTAAKDKAYRLRNELRNCAAGASMMREMDFSDSELTVAGEAQSMDGTINCVTQGAETQDYEACKSGITAYNAAMVAHQGLEIYEQVDFADFQMEQELAFQQNNAEGANGDFTFALKSQKAAIEKHAKQLEARAVFDAVKMGVFFGFMNGMPTKEDKVRECSGGVDCELKYIDFQFNEFITAFFKTLKTELENADVPSVGIAGIDGLDKYAKLPNPLPEAILQQHAVADKSYQVDEVTTDAPQGQEDNQDAQNQEFLPGFTAGGGDSNELPYVFTRDNLSNSNIGADQNADGVNRVCAEAAGGDPGMAIIENGEAREAMKGALLQATADLATHLLQKNILDKQAQRIQDAINGIQNFEPIPLTFTGEDLLGTLCAPDAFPSHPECLNLDTSKIYGFPGQSFNINGADAATTGQGLLGDNVEDNNSSDAIGNNNPDNRIANRNRTVARTRAGGNGGLRAGGGSGKLGGGSALGSASGGSSAPGGGTPSGGGSKGAGGKQAAQGKKRKIGGYNGSSAGTLAFGRGTGSSRAKKKAKNPFANFKKKNNQNGVLSFRNPAGIGSKSSNIFNMISSGYSRAVKGNKLLKYEAVKK